VTPVYDAESSVCVHHTPPQHSTGPCDTVLPDATNDRAAHEGLNIMGVVCVGDVLSCAAHEGLNIMGVCVCRRFTFFVSSEYTMDVCVCDEKAETGLCVSVCVCHIIFVFSSKRALQVVEFFSFVPSAVCCRLSFSLLAR